MQGNPAPRPAFGVSDDILGPKGGGLPFSLFEKLPQVGKEGAWSQEMRNTWN